MELNLEGIGKKFHSKWIFRGLSLNIEAGRHHAIVGKNGSGKSTLLMIAAGYLSPSAGTVRWKLNGKPLEEEKVFRQVAIAAPYLELVEEYTLEESILFQKRFKAFREPQIQVMLDHSGLGDHAHIPLKNFSSGMKQRARLMLAIMSEARLLLLDEPCSNLDADSIAWYQQMVDTWCRDRTLIIFSNHNTHEYHTSQVSHSLS
ncbi:MAG: ATP-binding cassette domain-containing protein [Bacteroidales bacterium]